MAERIVSLLYGFTQNIRDWAIRQRECIRLALFTLLLGITPVGKSFPFGFAFFLANDKHNGVTLAVLCLCCLVNGNAPLGLAVAVGLYAFKKLLEGASSTQTVKLCAGGVAAAFLCMEQIDGGIYNLAQGIVALSLVPIFSFLFSLYLNPAENAGTSARQAGLAALMFSVALFLVSFLPWKAPVLVLVILACLVAARDGGMLCGGFFGFCLGLSCGAGYGAMTAICGLCTGLLFSVGAEVAVPVGCAAGLCTGLYFYGADTVPYIILCFFIAGACFFVFGDRLHFLPEYIPKKRADKPQSSAVPFARAFSELAESALIAAGDKESAVRAADDYLNFSLLLQNAKRREEDEEEEDIGLYTKAAVTLKGAGLQAESI